MMDFIYVSMTAGFFVVSILYVYACGKL